MSLTIDQNNKRIYFIGRCVDENAVLPYDARMGITRTLTVQDLCAESITTLKQVGIQLEKVQQGTENSRFKKEGAAKISGITVNEWLDFIELTITKKEEEAKKAKASKELKELEKELETMKTPSERKKELLKRQKELQESI